MTTQVATDATNSDNAGTDAKEPHLIIQQFESTGIVVRKHRSTGRLQIVKLHPECHPSECVLYPKDLNNEYHRMVHSAVVKQLKPLFKKRKMSKMSKMVNDPAMGYEGVSDDLLKTVLEHLQHYENMTKKALLGDTIVMLARNEIQTTLDKNDHLISDRTIFQRSGVMDPVLEETDEKKKTIVVVPTVHPIDAFLASIFQDVSMNGTTSPIEFMHRLYWRWDDKEKQLWHSGFGEEDQQEPGRFEYCIETCYKLERGKQYSIVLGTYTTSENRVTFVLSNQYERANI